ncbi:MAG: hypothetical protein FWF43_08060 [Propionibacteriaceae bacterium]|nr:hypothetical protein [Propionibacteriaceae bacterium]
MASKSSSNRRKKSRRHKFSQGHVDEHVKVAMSSAIDAMGLLSDVLKARDPRAEVEKRIDNVAISLADGLAGYDPLGTLEAIRMATLPFAHAGDIPPAGAQTGPAVSEIMTVALLCAATKCDPANEVKRVDQELCGELGARLLPLAHELLDLATVRDLLSAGNLDDMTQLAAVARSKERWIRGTSYSDEQEKMLRGLFCAPAVDAGIRALVGFDVDEALSFLNTCHEMQIEQMNARGQRFADALNVIDITPGHVATDDEKRVAVDGFADFLNPSARQAAVPVPDVAARVGLSTEIADKVVGFFAAKPLERAETALRAYLDGNSPVRTQPLICRKGLAMIIHPALIADAVKSAFEDALKGSAYWDTYAAHRAKYLENRIADLFSQLVPGIAGHHGIEYFVPASTSEAIGDPANYTKLVEGDHLFVLHDVAFIVEDKAIPLSDRSRTGDLHPLRRNLGAAIKKGAEQAARMKRRIVEDHGLRLHDGSWLDLSDVREIHSVVTSLDDMPGIATATTKLVGAGLLQPEDIPWTVSLNDLDLIAQLVDRPAEFLLYVRRRTEPKVTEMFMAVDELDLFLLFFRTGLYVECDPEVVAREMPWLGKPRTADLRRYREQVPAFVTSQTDDLDAWYFSLHPQYGVKAMVAAPKPRMAPSPLFPLIDWLHDNVAFGWLSIGATLLEGSSVAQRRLAAYPVELTNNPSQIGQPRSVAVPWGLSKQSGWLLVWMIRPETMDGEKVVERAHAYMIVKKSQLGFQRGAAFVYDEPTGEIYAASYDSGQAKPDPGILNELVTSLRSPSDVDTQAQITQRHRNERPTKRTTRHR